MIKKYGNKASTFIVLAILVLVISFSGIASTAKATTTANDWTAQPLFQIRPAQAGAAPIGYSPQLIGTTSLGYSPQATGTTPTGYSPSQIKTAYKLPTSGGTGTIAIIDAYSDPNIANDLATFDNEYGLPTPSFTIENMAGTTTNAGWAVETSLDVEWAHAIAPTANILLVEAQSDTTADLMTAVTYATSYPGVVAVSMSWGASESSTELAYDSYLTSSTGIVFFASSGDSGAGVIWPSASPNVVSVGGTTLNLNSAGDLTSSGETAWSDSGGGVSTYEPLPTWQINYGLTYNGRVTPDVSFDANPSTGVAVYDSISYDGQKGWLEVGGTSVGAPSWAAIQALGLSTGVSNFYADGSPSSYFRDITSGSNGYSAAVGYDLVTGLGSPLTTSFTPQDFSISAAAVPTASAPIYAGSTTTQTVTTTVTVASLSTFTGTVDLTATGPSEISPSFTPTLTSSSVTITNAAPSVTDTLSVSVPAGTPAGTYQVTLTGAVGTISQSAAFTVKVQDFSISASPASLSIKSSSSGTSTITVTPISDFTGAVSLTATVPSGSGLTTSFSPSSVSITNPTTAVTSTLTVTAGTATGTYTITVTGVSGSISHSTTITVQVLPAPSVTVSPSSVTMDVGQSKTFTATATGGSGSYTSYQWYVDGSALSGQTESTFSYSPATAGSYTITATVTDSSGSTSAQSSAATVTVAASPTVSITPAGPLTMDVGQVQTFTAATSGGSGTINYQWYLDSSAVGSNSASYSYTASGTSHTITCKVTDSASTPVTSPTSNAVTITVSASPTVSITPVGPLTLDAGQSQTFTATATGGSVTIHYQWYLGSSAVSGATSSTYAFSESAGSYSVTCTVTDSASVPVTSAASNAVSVTVNQLTITVTQSANGQIAPGTTNVNYGGSQTFTITPNTGYSIASLTVYGSPVTVTSSYTFSNVQTSQTITATFAINTFTITVTQGTNGVIAPGTSTVNYGATPSFSITPNTGYHIATITANGASVTVTSPSGQSYQFSAVSADGSLTATFAINTYGVTVNVGADGSSNLASQTVNWNTQLNFVFTPEAGYSVSNVAVNGTSVGAVGSLSITVTGSTTVSVSFAINTYTLSVSVGADGSSNIASQTVNWGSAESFVFTPDTGYSVADVVVNGTVDEGAVASLSLTVTGDTSVSVSFAINTYIISASSGANGAISPSGSVPVNWGGSEAFTFTPDAGYHIADVLVNDTSVLGSVIDDGYTVSDVTGDTTISVSYAINQYSLTVTVDPHGSSNIASQTVNWGSVESFVFTPEAGYSISVVDVNGSLVGTSSSLTITVTGDTSVSVSFAINTYSLSPSAGVNGVISPSTPQTVDYGGSQVFTITPNTGYSIASLTVDGSPVTVASSYTFSNVEASHTISATFAPTPTPTPTPTPSPSPTATPTPAPTPSPTPTATSPPAPALTTTPPTTTPSTTPTPTATTVPATTATPTPTLAPTATISPTPSPTPLYLVLAAVIIVAAIVISIFSVTAIKRSRQKPDEALPNPETPI